MTCCCPAPQARAARGEQYTPRWWTFVGHAPNGKDLTMPPSARGSCWRFNGNYWGAQAAREWQGCGDLY